MSVSSVFSHIYRGRAEERSARGGEEATLVALSNRSHSPVDLRRCSPYRSWGHSNLGAPSVPDCLDFPVAPGSLGYRDDQLGLGCQSVLHLVSLGVRGVRGGPGCRPLDVPDLLSLLLDPSRPVAHSVRWCRGSLVCRWDPVPPVVPGVLSYRALLEVPALSALTLRTGGSGSGWSCNGTNGSG